MTPPPDEPVIPPAATPADPVAAAKRARRDRLAGRLLFIGMGLLLALYLLPLVVR